MSRSMCHAHALSVAALWAAVSFASAASAAAVPAAAPPSTWTKVATEGGSFSLSSSRAVRYGIHTSWVEFSVTGSARCTNQFFGTDPRVGVLKECWAAPASATPPIVAPPPSTWRKIATEGGAFSLSSAQPVRYGSGSRWVEKTVNGAGTCSNAFFGRDPISGVLKECWSPATTPPTPPPTSGDFHPANYSLWFNDEFNATQLDRTAWCTRYIYGGGAAPQLPDPDCQKNGEGTLDFLNDERQRYVDTNRSGETMHVVANGTLSLRATKTRTNDSWASYEAAMIRSKRTFAPTATTSYYITARMRLPNVKGSWPALWLNPDRKADGKIDWPPEIDILEGALNEVEDTQDMIRQGSQNKGGKQTASGKHEFTFSAPEFDRTWMNYYAGRSLRDVWVEVGAEWTTTGVCYFVDGYRTMCENYRWVNNAGIATAPAHVLLNLAVGGEWAGRHGIADDKFPTRFQIDYVRVYRKQ